MLVGKTAGKASPGLQARLSIALALVLLAASPNVSASAGQTVTFTSLPNGIGLYDSSDNQLTSDASVDPAETYYFKGASGSTRLVGFTITGSPDLTPVALNYTGSQIFFSFGGVIDVSATHTLLLPVTDGAGVYVCPTASSIGQVNQGCAGVLSFTRQECAQATTKSSITCRLSGNSYAVSGLTSTGMGYLPTTRLLVWDHTNASFSVGDNANATGYAATALGNGDALGTLSLAAQGGTAAGPYALALGISTYAGNTSSVAIGYSAFSTAYSSVALGYLANATGNYSIAIGANILAQGLNSQAFGRDLTNPTANSFAVGFGDITLNVTDNLVRVVGDVNATGVVCDGAGNCLNLVGGLANANNITQLWGNVSSTVVNVTALRGNVSEVVNNITGLRGNVSSAIVNITALQGNVTGLWTNASNQDARIIGLEAANRPYWINQSGSISSNASINKGNVNVTGNLTVAGNIVGVGSSATGGNTFAFGGGEASGYAAVAFGGGQASGNYSLAVGDPRWGSPGSSGIGSLAVGSGAVAFGNYAAAIGLANGIDLTYASGEASLAVGKGAKAYGDYSQAFGEWTQAYGKGSFGAGLGSTINTHRVDGISSVIIGYDNQAPGNYSQAFGYMANVTSNYAMAAGLNILAGPGASSFAFGRNFTNPTANSFQVGFGDATLNVTDNLVRVIGDVNATGRVCDGTGYCIQPGGGGYVPFWLDQGGRITTNASIDSGNVNVTGNLTVTGRLGVGTSNPASFLEVQANARDGLIYSTTYSPALQAYQSGIVGRKARGTSTSPTAVTAGENLLALAGRGYHGTAFSAMSNALITLQTEEDFNSTHQGTNIQFETTGLGHTYNDRTERMRISADGYVGINTYTPSERLHVNGTANVTEDVYAGGDINATGIVCDGAGNCLNLVGGLANANNITQLWGNLSSAVTNVTALRDNVSLAVVNVSALQGNVTGLWSNASNQDTRIIALEGAGPANANNITQLWGNLSSTVVNVTALRGNVSEVVSNVTGLRGNVSAAVVNITALQGNVSALWTNASVQESRIASVESVVRPYWVNESGSISSNISINKGNVNVTGNLTVTGTRLVLYGSPSALIVDSGDVVFGGYMTSENFVYNDSLGSVAIGGSQATNSRAFAAGSCIASGQESACLGGNVMGLNVVDNTFGVVLGGANNAVNGQSAAILGGEHNLVERANSAVIGGAYNSITNENSVVLGGSNNMVSGRGSTAAGYRVNVTGNYSLAAGYNIQAGTATANATQYVFAFGRDFVNPTTDSFQVGFGQNATLVVNATRVVVPDTKVMCFGSACDACMYWNGTHMVQESPCTR